MLKVKISKIINYAGRNEEIIQLALKEFFDDRQVDLPETFKEQINSLFNEWLIYDFKPPSGMTILKDYYLKNPDNLSVELLTELKQIIETQIYDLFEIDKVKPGQWLEVWGLFTGKKYRVYEITLSTNLNNQRGGFYNRVAKIDGKYYFIGSNPLLFPITHTDRSRKFYRSATNKSLLSPKNVIEILIKQEENKNSSLHVSKHDIEIKRQKLEKKFNKLIVKYHLKTSFKQLVEFVYNETYTSHFADFYKDITCVGIPEQMIVNNLQFFQDLWNYFPHKKLNNKCPAEKYREVYG